MLPPQLEHTAGKLVQLALLVQPAQLIVLTVGIVVAALRASKLIARNQHRRALRQEQRREQVPPLARAQQAHLWILAWALCPAIPRVLVIVAVLVALAVGVVVLVIVADEIAEGKAVVCGDEVDA